MSHIVVIPTKLRDPAGIAAACRRLGLAEPVQGTAKLYSEQATGLMIQLPGWKYAAVIDPTSGEIRYDNFGGTWGDPSKLDQFLQIYAVETARLEARRRGHQVSEQVLADGSIKLTIAEGSP